MKNVLISIVVALLVLLGAGFVWYLLQSSASTPEPAPTAGGQPAGPVTVMPEGRTQEPVAMATTVSSGVEVDLDAEFEKLCGTLGAEQVWFSAVSFSGGAGSIYDLYSADVAYSKHVYPEAAPTFHMAALDLNGDGVGEAIVYEDLPGFCGSGGCPIEVHVKNGGVWRRVLSAFGSGTVGVLRGGSGFDSILITTEGGEGGTGVVERYVWDSSEYKPFGIVATWNGTTFTPVQ